MAYDFALRHPEYQHRTPEWAYNRDHFEGGRRLVVGSTSSTTPADPVASPLQTVYLSRHEAESQSTFSQRLARAPGLYLNLVAHALLVYRSHVMRIEPQRTLPDALEPMMLDADLFGTSATQLFTNVFDEAQLQGISFVLVDAPEMSGVRSEAEARTLRLRPWLEPLRAESLIDWDIETQATETRGQFRYAVVKDTVWRKAGPFMSAREITRYRMWTPQLWQRWEADGAGSPVLVAEGENRIGRVPIVPCYERYRGPMQGGTVLDEVARKANALWNRSSVRDENFYRQGFSLLVIAASSLDKDKAIEVGATRGLLLGTGESAAYESPGVGIFQAYAEFAREMLEQSADLVFARTARHQLPSAQIESAAKREVDRREFVALLESKAARIEECERRCWEMAGLYYGIKVAEGETWVSYSRDFRVHELEADEWIKRMLHGVASPVEWRLALHPEESEEEATEAVLTNQSEWATPSEPVGTPKDLEAPEAEGEMPTEADAIEPSESGSEG